MGWAAGPRSLAHRSRHSLSKADSVPEEGRRVATAAAASLQRPETSAFEAYFPAFYSPRQGRWVSPWGNTRPRHDVRRQRQRPRDSRFAPPAYETDLCGLVGGSVILGAAGQIGCSSSTGRHAESSSLVLRFTVYETAARQSWWCMNIVLLALIGLVLLMGLVAIGIGHRGWNWGTIAAAVLLLMAATGYLYLAARLAERERSWRLVVTRDEKAIAQIRDGGPAAKPLKELKEERFRWLRALTFVDTWRGRSWQHAALSPPRVDNTGKVTPGNLSIDKANEESEQPPLEAGAEVAVFDSAGVKEEGRFLGLFRVQAVNANKGSEKAVLTIVPACTPDPPSEADVKLWTHEYEDVIVYESMPVDRWLAYHRTPSGTAAAEADRWMPQPRKADALEGLEQQMEDLLGHDEEVPEAEWQALGKKLADGTRVPGSDWAVVEFTKNIIFTKQDKFAIDDEAPAAPAEPGAEADDDDGPIPEPEEGGATLGTGAEVASPAAVISKRFKEMRLKEGTTAEFDLQTALELQDDKQFAKIIRVFSRRPLADTYTALRGGEFEMPDENGKPRPPVKSQGIDAIRRGLLEEIKAVNEGIARVASARDSVEAQAAAATEETSQLDADLESWEKDITAADEIATAFNDRLKAATIELATLETLIVRLGQELTGANAVLTEQIDGMAPPPQRQPR